MTEKYQIIGSVVTQAEKMMSVLNRYFDGRIEDLGFKPQLMPEATPPFFEALITSATEISLNYLTRSPKVHIYITEEKNKSFLTLLNVLVHEATHAYSPLILAAVRSLSELLKLKSWLSLRFYLLRSHSLPPRAGVV